MRSSIANLKENISKIVLDVHGDVGEQLGIYGAREGLRLSQNHTLDPPLPNGIAFSFCPEIEQYKAEIKRLEESEAQIKALSVNYAALLKEKEDHITRLNQEFSSLKQKFDATSAALVAARNDASRASTASSSSVKGGPKQSPSQQNKLSSNKTCHSGNQWLDGYVSKQVGHSNGYAHLPGSEKELADLLEEKDKSLAALQAKYEEELKNLHGELGKECNRSSNVQLKLREEQNKIHTYQEELNSVKSDRDKTSIEINRLSKELNDRRLKIRQLEEEIVRRKDQEADHMGSMKRLAATLEKENMNQKSAHLPGSFLGKDELESSVERPERELKETRQERDKALQVLARLRQHLLDKESEESERMDEDSKVIEELREQVEYQKVTMLNMERALQQAYASQEEAKSISNTELQRSKETIADLKEKLGACMHTIDSKNAELQNLETALGQYCAEIEAKERLESDLSIAREECIRLGQSLQDLTHQIEVSKKEKEEIMAKLEQMENMVAIGKGRVNKLEEDNAKLGRALEQSMTRLNRMSVDSDFLVDRRIVIKLLVTYFQRNHSKEVLDLMVRMLGFSDEDKQRVGVAQQGTGKGGVHGVLGFPGRLVGGILSGSSTATQTHGASDNQSFADLWVDFLIKESEEREKRESAEAVTTSGGSSKGDETQVASPGGTGMVTTSSDQRMSKFERPPGLLAPNPPPSLGKTSRSVYSRPGSGLQQYEFTGSEFSTVPPAPSEQSLELKATFSKRMKKK